MQDSVMRFIEVEYDCAVTELAITRIPRTKCGGCNLTTHGLRKVDGIAYRNGQKLIVGGTVNEHNYSGIKIYGPEDDPFAGL